MARSARGVFTDLAQLRLIQDMLAMLDQHEEKFASGEKVTKGSSKTQAAPQVVKEEIVQNKYPTAENLEEIKLLPSDFTGNKDINVVSIRDDKGGYCTAGTGIGIATKEIPIGYRAITVTAYGNTTESPLPVKVYRCNIETDAAVEIGSGEIGEEIGIDIMDSDESNYISVAVNVKENERIYGGKIKVKKV